MRSKFDRLNKQYANIQTKLKGNTQNSNVPIANDNVMVTNINFKYIQNRKNNTCLLQKNHYFHCGEVMIH